MKYENFERFIELLESSRGCHFSGPKPEAWVRNAEEALGVLFPPSYRQFVTRLGGGNCAGSEFYGVSRDPSLRAPSGVVNVTQELRDRRAQFPRSLLVIGELGDGSYYAIDTAERDASHESPIVWVHDDGCKIETLAESFGEFMFTELHQAGECAELCVTESWRAPSR